MSLLPFVSRHLLGAIGLVCVGACASVIGYSAQAAELEGTPVPVTNPVPAVTPPTELPVINVPVVLDTAVPAPQPIEAPLPADSQIAAPAPQLNHLSPEMLAIQSLERRLESVLEQRNNDHQAFFETFEFVPIVAIIFSIGGPLFLLGFVINKRYQDKRQRRQNLNDNIDKLLAAGRDIPVELLRGDEPPTASAASRDRGVRNIFIGAGLLTFLTILAGISIGAIGFIWIALGLSQVVIWSLNQPQAGQSLTQQVEQQD